MHALGAAVAIACADGLAARGTSTLSQTSDRNSSSVGRCRGCRGTLPFNAPDLDTDQRIDVLFLDLNWGGDPEAGLLVAQQAHARWPKLSYLYTTGAGVNEGMKAMFVEPFLFLPKPYTLEQLTKSVAFLLLATNPRPRPKFSEPPQSN
jgi:hypothetical protein